MSTMELPPKTDLYAEDQSDDKSDDKPDDKSDEMSAALLMENRAKADAMSVNIRAPSTLPGGYELTVEIDGKQLTVLVVRRVRHNMIRLLYCHGL